MFLLQEKIHGAGGKVFWHGIFKWGLKILNPYRDNPQRGWIVCASPLRWQTDQIHQDRWMIGAAQGGQTNYIHQGRWIVCAAFSGK